MTNLTLKFHVYIDWTIEEIPRAFYVGKGMMRRVNQTTRTKHHKNISEKHGCRREIVFSADDENAAFAEEINLILVHKTFVYAENYSGFGCNYTRGGDGASGGTHTVSAEARKLMSEQKMGNQNALGSKRTVKQRENLSRSMIGHSISNSTRAKISKTLLGRKNPGAFKNSRRVKQFGNKFRAKPVEQLTQDGIFIARFESARAAAKSSGAHTSKISLCCNGKISRTAGFSWRFCEDGRNG